MPPAFDTPLNRISLQAIASLHRPFIRVENKSFDRIEIGTGYPDELAAVGNLDRVNILWLEFSSHTWIKPPTLILLKRRLSRRGAIVETLPRRHDRMAISLAVYGP